MKAILPAVLVLLNYAGPLRAEPVVDGWPLSAWIGRLKSSDFVDRTKACGALAQLEAEAAPAVPALIELFRNSSDVTILQFPAKSLAAIGPAAVEPLTQFLTDTRPKHRAAAAQALGWIRIPAKASVPALVKALKDPDSAVGRAAAVALWLIEKNPAGIAVLAEGLTSADISTRRECALRLRDIGPPARVAVPALIKSLSDRLNQVGASEGKNLPPPASPSPLGGTPLPPLLVLVGGHRPMASLAAEALAHIGPDARSAVPALKALLRPHDKSVGDENAALDLRVSAALALVALNAETDAALPVLLEGLRAPWIERWNTKQAPIRQDDEYQAVLVALERLGPIAVPALVRALDHKDVAVRVAAMEALDQFNELPIEALPALRRLTVAEPPGQVRLRAVFAVVRSGEKLDTVWPAVRENMKYLGNRMDGEDGKKLLHGLDRAKATIVPLLAKELADEDVSRCAAAAQLLAHLGPSARSAIPALSRVIKEEPERLPDEAEWPARTWAAIAVVHMGEPPAEFVPLLIQAHNTISSQLKNLESRGLENGENRQRYRAIREVLVLVARIHESRVLPSLMELLGVNRGNDREAAAALLLDIHKAKTAPVVKALGDALLVGDVSLREEAAKLLVTIGRDGREALPALHAALTDPEPSVRIRAAVALWRIEGKAEDVLPILREELKNPDSEVRVEAVKALGELGTAAESCLADVANCWGDEAFNVVREDIYAFFRITPDAVPALLKVLEHKNAAARAEAARLLGEFGPAAMAPLIRTIDRTEGDVRIAAVEALNRHGEAAKDALPVLRPLLKHGDLRLRFSVALAVWNIGKEVKETLPIFLYSVRHLDAESRRRAADALRSMGAAAEGSAPVLEQALGDDEESVRVAAIVALASVTDGKRSLPVLLRLLRNDPSDEVRRYAAYILGQLGKDDAVAKAVVLPLTASLKDRTFNVRSSAGLALFTLHQKVLPPLQAIIDVLDDDAAWISAVSLLTKCGPAAVPHLTAALSHNRPAVRLAAADVLARIGPAAHGAASELMCALNSQNAELRIAAANALRCIGPKAKEAIYMLRGAAEHEDEQFRTAAKAALAAIDKP